MSVRQLIYVSELSPHVGPDCVRDILKESLARNPQMNVSGMLLYINGSFLQVLEGQPEDVEVLYGEKISSDPRHSHARVLLDSERDEPDFLQWSMGFAAITAHDMDAIAGMNDFFTQGHCLTEIESDQTMQILSAFRDGKWRAQLS